MDNKIEIYQSADNSTEIRVQFDQDTVWLTQTQMGEMFGKARSTITEHIRNIFAENELQEKVVCRNFRRTTQHGAIEGKTQEQEVRQYNLDVIISVGYRVKSQQGTKFRQWATQRLKDYLIQGYAINEKRLAEKQMEVECLKTGIRIMSRAIEEVTEDQNNPIFQTFSHGLALLDDYDHQNLDNIGSTQKETIYPHFDEYMHLIDSMYSQCESDVFAKPKDDSFHSSINQISQTVGGADAYPTIEEKAANLLYFVTKNHSFVDGNKRIAAACFLYFLEQNSSLRKKDGTPLIDNATLAALTLFVAISKTEEAEIVKKLIISILNRNKGL